MADRNPPKQESVPPSATVKGVRIAPKNCKESIRGMEYRFLIRW
jgi:hypothetical protein